MRNPKDEIDLDEISNEIAMDNSHTEICIIVEGATDAKLLEDFTVEDKCSIYLVKTRENVIELMRRLEALNKNQYTIGIVDDDQHRITGENLPANTIYTDTNDIETMIFWSGAFPKIARQLFAFGSTADKNKVVEIQKFLQKCAIPIGEMRLADKRMGWKLSFKDSGGKKDLDFCKLFNWKDDMSFLGDKVMINVVKGHSKRPEIDEKEALKELKAVRQYKYSPKQIIVGHDLTRVIAVAMKKKYYKKETEGYDKDQIEVSFRLAYSLDLFKKSNLYQAMKGMMSHHGIDYLQ